MRVVLAAVVVLHEGPHAIEVEISASGAWARPAGDVLKQVQRVYPLPSRWSSLLCHPDPGFSVRYGEH